MKTAFDQALNDNRDISHRAGTRGHWRRESLEEFRDRIGPDRRLQDGFDLYALFEEMKKSPTADAALKWALSNRIEFIVDHTAKAGGYYWPGTGVVAVGARCLRDKSFMAQAVNVLTHEIRHAWQDYHGLLYCPLDAAGAVDSALGRDLAIEGLYEADAAAHGFLAEAEYRYHHSKERVTMLEKLQEESPTPERADLLETFKRATQHEHRACADPQSVLWRHFTGWYHGGISWSIHYGAFRRDTYAAALGLAPPPADKSYEYRPPEGLVLLPPPDFANRATLDQLGRSFAGVNYLQSKTARDTVARFLLPAGSADRGFPRIKHGRLADRYKASARVRQVRTVQTRNRLQKHPLPVRPLPK